MNDNSRHVECTIPILPVSNLARSIAFYTNKLGFKLDWGGSAGDAVCSVSRDGCSIMLMVKPRFDVPSWVWIGLEDESLFEVYRANGVRVVQEPRNCSWAYEVKFEDIDGNILWMGTEPRKDQPFVDRQKLSY
jgi:predicted lactoylglutathione lyase